MVQREWETIKGFDFKDILFESYNHIAKITINRERYRNAFTPLTTWEMSQAFSYCRECQDIRVVILTGAGDKAFCSGGDMHVKGRGGYIGTDGVPRLNILDVQMQIRRLPKPVIAMVNGYAIGGGHVLHVMCDLTIASEHAVLGKPVRRWVRSMPVSVPAIWHVWWDRRKLAKYGSSANNIAQRKLKRWGWSTRLFLLRNWKILVWSGAK